MKKSLKGLKSLLLSNVMAVGIGAVLGGGIVGATGLSGEVVYAQESVTKTVNVSQLNVRANPKTGAKVLGFIEKGDVVTVTDVIYGWNEITYNGETAYVDGRYLTTDYVAPVTATVTTPVATPVTTTPSTTLPVTKVVNVDFLNFRSAPSNSGSIITAIKKGDVVTVVEVVNGWNKFTVNGKTGYSYGKFLTETNSAATLPTTAPVVEAPVVEAPVVEAPVVEAPVVEIPVVIPEIVIEAPAVVTPDEPTIFPELAEETPVAEVEEVVEVEVVLSEDFEIVTEENEVMTTEETIVEEVIVEENEIMTTEEVIVEVTIVEEVIAEENEIMTTEETIVEEVIAEVTE